MKCVSWNVNGFRAMSAKPEWDWFKNTTADIVALQEVKVDAEQLEEHQRTPEGWQSFWLSGTGKKGYSGVAVFVRDALAQYAKEQGELEVVRELPVADLATEGRLLQLSLPDCYFFGVYFPNGSKDETRLAYKMAYYEAFLEHVQTLRQKKPIVVCGDFNTAHTAIDLARPKANVGTSGFLPEERAFMDRFVAAGYVDTFRLVHGNMPDMYTWWSYKQRARENNVGWRIDYFFVSEELVPKVRDAWIENRVLGSDHCPVGLELDCA